MDGRSGKWEYLRIPRRDARLKPAKGVHPDWPRDVLDLVLPLVLEGVWELVPNLLVDLAGDADPARVGELLQAGRHVHAIAVHIAIILTG